MRTGSKARVRLLLDRNVDRLIINSVLQPCGIRFEPLYDQQYEGWDDERVLEEANVRNSVLISMDGDFHNHNVRSSPGVILLKSRGTVSDSTLRSLAQLLREHPTKSFYSGRFIIIRFDGTVEMR